MVNEFASFITRRCFSDGGFFHVALPRSVACLLLLAAVPLAAQAATWSARAQPQRLVNGAPVLFQVKAPFSLESLSGTWLGHHVPFSFDSSTKTWIALAGISIETAPGAYALDLTGERPASNGRD